MSRRRSAIVHLGLIPECDIVVTSVGVRDRRRVQVMDIHSVRGLKQSLLVSAHLRDCCWWNHTVPSPHRTDGESPTVGPVGQNISRAVACIAHPKQSRMHTSSEYMAAETSHQVGAKKHSHAIDADKHKTFLHKPSTPGFVSVRLSRQLQRACM